MKTPSTFLLLLLAMLLAGIAVAQSGKVAPMTGLSLHKSVRSESRILASHHTPTSSVTNFGTMDFPASPASGAWGINDNGQIVGAYGPDLGPDIGDAGFYLSKGSFESVRFPGQREPNASVSTGMVRLSASTRTRPATSTPTN